ncbi:MAG: thiamine ABC transporter substrate-binding protein [Actinobacteria bacterium]|nr:thiamine ABC transporter substrate-binding protein [Actinomycetota bacterium]
MKKKIAIALLATAVMALTGCAQTPDTVRLAAHDSFAISDELIQSFEEQSGFELEIVRLGDTGSLTNQLSLTKNAPIADVVFGIDNTFQSLAIESGIAQGDWVAIDYSDVCFNYDISYFEQANLTPPSSWRDLIDPKYEGLTVVTNPRLSSPGLAFLATTFAGFETNAEVFAYWRGLRDNRVKVAGSWEDAYFVDFTRYGGEKPIVLSYASSPAAEVVDGEAQTAALRNECFRQTEYAAVLTNSPNTEGAKQFVDFLTSEAFQASVAEAMYVYPAVTGVEVPRAWAEHAQPATSVLGEDLDFAANRERWLKDWSDVFDN